ncbi:hypothetical protein FQN57_002587 [Myotisia sp. PD_48]|nr:hypothetical protein FQN57_002587 [Myotisia sp. PD_48]
MQLTTVLTILAVAVTASARRPPPPPPRPAPPPPSPVFQQEATNKNNRSNVPLVLLTAAPQLSRSEPPAPSSLAAPSAATPSLSAATTTRDDSWKRLHLNGGAASSSFDEAQTLAHYSAHHQMLQTLWLDNIDVDAPSHIKAEFRRVGSSFSNISRRTSSPMPNATNNGPTNGSAYADEHTGLLHGNGNGVSPSSVRQRLLWMRGDHRLWVSIPSEAFHITYATLGSNYINILLIFVPLGLVSDLAGWSPVVTFVLNFIAIIPLASLLSFATEELAVTLGDTLGGLLNATFGNAVELIVSIVALLKGEIRIVQASMLGSILSNILLVLGCCFLFGGLRHHEQRFNSTVASTMSSLMAVASASLIIPATLYAALAASDSDAQGNILILSHGTAIILLVLYIMYLYFQLGSHSDLFESADDSDLEEAEGHSPEEEQILNPWAAGLVLLAVTIAVSFCADHLVGSINSIVEAVGISRTFIGLILIPIVGNAAEHVTAVVVAYKNKMDLAIGVAIGSSLQIALFVTPFLVILGWIIGQEMTLHFQTFETVTFFLSGLVVTLLIQDGKSNYLEGGLCLGMLQILPSRSALSCLRATQCSSASPIHDNLSQTRNASSQALRYILTPSIRCSSLGRSYGCRMNSTASGSNGNNGSDSKENTALKSDQEKLANVSEEAAETAKIMERKECGEVGGPELEQGSPVADILKRDKDAFKTMPKVLRDQILSGSNGGGSKRSFSTTARLQQDPLAEPDKTTDAQISNMLTAAGITGLQPEEQLPGFKFAPPTLPLPRSDRMKRRYEPLVEQFTKLMMKDGKLSLAQKHMAKILDHLRTAPAPLLDPSKPLLPAPPGPQLPLNPILYLTLVVDSLAPLFRMRMLKGLAGGGASLPLPKPLVQRQRRRTAISWILELADKRKDNEFAMRVANEVVSVAEGRSAAWLRRAQVHKIATSSRSNIRMAGMKRRKKKT